jgi:hypothetical protein
LVEPERLELERVEPNADVTALQRDCLGLANELSPETFTPQLLRDEKQVYTEPIVSRPAPQSPDCFSALKVAQQDR